MAQTPLQVSGFSVVNCSATSSGAGAGSAPAVAALALIATLALLLTLTALFLPPVLLPPVALPLPSAVAEAEPAPVVPETPPKVEVEAVVLGKEEKPKLAPAEGEVKLPTAGVPAACPGSGLESSAGAADDGSPLPAQWQLE